MGDDLVEKAVACVLGENAVRLRANAPPALTTVPGWAQELVPTTLGRFILSLAGKTAYADIAARTQPLTLAAGTQKIILGGEIAAQFTAEGEPIGIQQGSMSTLTLPAKRIAAAIVFSEELGRSAANLEATLRSLLRTGVGVALDTAFFAATAETPAAPAGILNGLSSLTPTPVTGSITPVEAMRQDLRNLVAALVRPVDPVFVMRVPRRVIAKTTLPASFDYPIFTTSVLPDDRVICIDADALAAAQGAEPKFQLSSQAAVHMDNAAAPISAVGTPNTISAPVRSFFQENLIGLRVMLPVTWAVRSGGVSFVDGINW